MHKRINTVLLSTLYPSAVRPNHGVFVETRLRKLVDSGEVDTRVVAPVPWFPSKNERFGEYAKFARTPIRENRNGVDILHPRYFLPPRIGMSISPIALALGARSAILQLLSEGFEFDLFDAHYYYPDGVAAAILASWFKKPFIVTARGSDLNVLADFRIPRSWIQWTHSQAFASMFVSEALRDRMVQLTGSPAKMHVVRNGVDFEQFQALEREKCKRSLGLDGFDWILYVGRLTRPKGVHQVVQAVSLLPEHVKLAIVGEGEELSSLAEISENLGISDRVKFVGSLPQDMLPTWYSAASVLLLPSEREGTPNVVLEALACGTPAVATAVGGVPEIVNSDVAGRLVDFPLPQLLASAVIELLELRYPQAAVREHAQQFGWDETTNTQTKLFRSAASRQESLVR